MKRLLQLLNIVMGAFVGVLIGRSAYTCWRYTTHPEYYAMQSAPWYTGILLEGAFTLAVLAVCLLIKFILKKRNPSA